MLSIILLLLLASSSQEWWSYDKGNNRENLFKQTDEKSIEIFDKDYNRKGHIRKEGDQWIEYDKEWNRIRIYRDR